MPSNSMTSSFNVVGSAATHKWTRSIAFIAKQASRVIPESEQHRLSPFLDLFTN